VKVVYGLGSNLGDRLAHLQAAVDLLQPCVLSGVWETDPVGGPEQQDFYNAVCVVDVQGDPLALAHAAEQAAGRVREVHWGPRTLDVDVIDVPGTISHDGRLTLPHPRAAQRAFVLVPWLQLDAQAVLTGHGPVADLVAGLDTAGVRPRPDLVLR
jgi:2-amino-4-hydroxy-6-hydroxymethyldihydropteridine diphosphokinase